MKHEWLEQYPPSVNATIDMSQASDVASLIEATCKKFDSATALTCMGTDISFRQFNRLSDDFASYLQNDLGLKKGDRIAIMLPNIIQFPIALFGAMKIGVVCVNTNPLYTPPEMRHQFKDSGAKAIIILDMFAAKLDEIIEETDIEHVIVTGIGDQLPIWKARLVKTALHVKRMIPKYTLEHISFKDALKLGSKSSVARPEIDGGDLALLQYTGGTTGVSKGAMLTQDNIMANMFQIQEWARPYVTQGNETILTALPLYHIFALTVNFLSFLTMGGRMILVPRPIPIENTIKLFKKYNITVMTGVNTLYNAMVENEMFKALAPRHLKVALAGGMALQTSVARAFQDITGTRILEGYGLTEASPVTHCNPLHVEGPDLSIGLPLPSTQAKVVDENGLELGVGDVGELVVKGPQVMKGYWQRPDETIKTFHGDWLKTGDMAKKDEKGYFYIVDRKKDMILVSGFNVYPNEVENIIASHPKVLEVAVIGVPDQKQGESVKAFVVAKDKSLTESELKDHCAGFLVAYKRPKHYQFTDDLPKTNVGKVLRRELKDKDAAVNTEVN